MKKLIAILVIGGMFIFVSVQCALTNNNQSIEQQAKIDFSPKFKKSEKSLDVANAKSQNEKDYVDSNQSSFLEEEMEFAD